MLPSDNDVTQYPKHLDMLRFSCAFMLYMYGVSKLVHLQFNLSAELAPRPVGSLNGYQLTWFYYGYSRVYACLLGMIQVIGATLLLFRKTTLLAAMIMLPVMANIVLINMFILVNDYGPYVISILICTSLLLIAWHQRAVLVSALWSNQPVETAHSRRAHQLIRVAIVLTVGVIIIGGAIVKHAVRR